MSKLQTYNFPDHKSGDTFPGVIFTMDAAAGTGVVIAGALIELLGDPDNNVILDNADLGGISILEDDSDGNERFMIDEQIIDWPPRTYNYSIRITLSVGYVKTFVEGEWNIRE